MRRFLAVAIAVLTLGFSLTVAASSASKLTEAHRTGKSSAPQILPCQICTILIKCWSCLNANSDVVGAPICFGNCDSCHLMGTCSGGIGQPGDDDDDNAETAAPVRQSLSSRRLTLNASVLAAVAAKYPRMAILLAKINREGGFRNLPSRMYMTPVQITKDDLDENLAAGFMSPEYEQQIHSRAEELNEAIAKGQIPAVIYDIRPRAFNSDNPVIKIKVVQGASSDPAYSELVLRFSQQAPAAVSGDQTIKPLWKVEWELLK